MGFQTFTGRSTCVDCAYVASLSPSYYFTGYDCMPCPLDYTCKDGMGTPCEGQTVSCCVQENVQRSNQPCQLCPNGRYKNWLHVGVYLGVNEACLTCERGFYCRNGVRNKCGNNSETTNVGQSLCTCKSPSYYWVNHSDCAICPAGFWCEYSYYRRPCEPGECHVCNVVIYI